MDKDKFRELLQTFEQLSVKPETEADGEAESEVALPSTPLLTARRTSSMYFSAEPAVPDLDRLMECVRDSNTSFPELEATHPLPDSERFRPSSILKSTAAEEYSGESGMRFQQQLHTASRFRLMAGLAARLYLQVSVLARDRTLGKSARTKLTGIEDDMVAICSANLVEAEQLELRAQEDHAEAMQRAEANAEAKAKAALETTEGPVTVEAANGHTTKEPKAAAATSAVVANPEEVPLGARLSCFADAWSAMGAEADVLETVRNGMLFDFSATPEYVCSPDPEYTAEESAAIEKVIRWDLGDKVIEEVPYRPDLFYSHMYTLRIGGKLKSLVEFRLLNKYLEAGTISVEEAPSLCSMLEKNDWITRISIKCAYPSVPIHPDHRRYLVFKYDERYYQYRAMPFGISVASRVFTRLLQAALRPLRAEGFRVTSHIDEICLLHSSSAELTEQTKRLCRHLMDLGFLINMSTSDLVPQQNQRFLGFVFNTLSGSVQFPKDQIKKVRRAAHTARASKITAKQLASLLGKIRSIMPAVGPELSRIREIERCLDAFITTPESWDDVIPLSPPALAEIDWLCESLLVQKSLSLGPIV